LRLPNLEYQVSVFIYPRNRVAQLHPKALSSLFVASYDSQGDGGGIRTLLHTGSVIASNLTFVAVFSGGRREVGRRESDDTPPSGAETYPQISFQSTNFYEISYECHMA
jgi:hypothetical protein